MNKQIFLRVWLLVLGIVNPLLAAQPQAVPLELYNKCSQELHRCIKSHKTTAETYSRNLDICWREVRQCPQTCIDEYDARRDAGIIAWDANPLLKGRSYEPSSCIPGMDEIKFPGRKLLPVDSRLHLTLEWPNKTKSFAAVVDVKPLDDKGKVAVTRDNPSRQARYEKNPLLLPLPAGRYRILIKPLMDSSDLGEQLFTVALKKGQSLRRTVTLEPPPPAVQGIGTLHLVGPSPENPVFYSLIAADKATMTSSSPLFPKRGLHGLGTSRVDLSLPSGRYRLTLRPKNYAGGEHREEIEIKPGKVLTQKIELLQPGRLNIAVHGLADGQEAMLHVSRIGDHASVLTTAVRSPSLVVSLAPGQYQATLDVLNNGPIYGPQRAVPLTDIVVQPGRTLDLQANIPAQHWGTLKLNALLESQPVKVHVQLALGKHPDFVIYPAKRKNFPESMPMEIALQEGSYLLNVWGEEAKDKAHPVFPQPRFERNDIPIDIKEGEVLSKTFSFKKQHASELTLRVLLNGIPAKARIKGRRSDSNDLFNPVGATYNLLSNNMGFLPGTYDLWVQPLEIDLSPGIDVFHGRKGQLISQKLAKGTKPIILHNVEIKPDSSTMRTMRFESAE